MNTNQEKRARSARLAQATRRLGEDHPEVVDLRKQFYRAVIQGVLEKYAGYFASLDATDIEHVCNVIASRGAVEPNLLTNNS